MFVFHGTVHCTRHGSAKIRPSHSIYSYYICWRQELYTEGKQTFEATVPTDDLVFTGVEACVGHGVFASSTEEGQLC